MHKKEKGIAQFIGLAAGLVFSFCIPPMVKGQPPASYTLRSITITSTGAIEPTVRYPYLRLVKWLTPTTDASLINSYIWLKPGATFDAQTLRSIKKRLTALPYFATVSVTRKGVNGDGAADGTPLSDLVIETKDRLPITPDLSLDEGPLFTLTHHNLLGYGHALSNQFFLKKRWGYGFIYELPKLHGNYFFGGQYYNQTAQEGNYTFNYRNLWAGKLLAITAKDPCAAYYWITGLSYYQKKLVTDPPVSVMENSHNYRLFLGKIGWVADDYTSIRGVYRLHALESLPKGGSIEMLYGYQMGDLKNRHYIGISCIKNSTNPTLRHLHLSCESGAFIHKKTFEEAVLKLGLAYAGPPIQTCNGARQFIAIDYIVGFRMAKGRMLGIKRYDPEALELPKEENRLQEPIHARLNIHLDSTLHMPIMVNAIRFVCLGFVDFIALYNQHHAPLNQTWVDSYGIGLQFEHVTMSWLAATVKMGYSPLLGKALPSVQLAMHTFKNKTNPKPRVVAYS